MCVFFAPVWVQFTIYPFDFNWLFIIPPSFFLFPVCLFPLLTNYMDIFSVPYTYKMSHDKTSQDKTSLLQIVSATKHSKHQNVHRQQNVPSYKTSSHKNTTTKRPKHKTFQIHNVPGYKTFQSQKMSQYKTYQVQNVPSYKTINKCQNYPGQWKP